MQPTIGKQVFSRCGEHVNSQGKYDDNPQWFNGQPHEPHWQARQAQTTEGKGRHNAICYQTVCKEDRNDKDHGGYNLGPWIHAVEQRISWKVLSDGNIT